MNKVSHFEIPADNLDQARDLYSKVFGWTIKEWDDSGSYLSVRTVPSDDEGNPTEPGGINGGIQKRGPRAKNPTFVIEVEDIDKAIEDIEANGGSVAVNKEDMGGMGQYAQFEDPEGNRLGLFQKA